MNAPRCNGRDGVGSAEVLAPQQANGPARRWCMLLLPALLSGCGALGPLGHGAKVASLDVTVAVHRSPVPMASTLVRLGGPDVATPAAYAPTGGRPAAAPTDPPPTAEAHDPDALPRATSAPATPAAPAEPARDLVVAHDPDPLPALHVVARADRAVGVDTQGGQPTLTWRLANASGHPVGAFRVRLHVQQPVVMALAPMPAAGPVRADMPAPGTPAPSKASPDATFDVDAAALGWLAGLDDQAITFDAKQDRVKSLVLACLPAVALEVELAPLDPDGRAIADRDGEPLTLAATLPVR